MPEKTENEVSLNTPRLGHLVRLGLAYMASGGALLMSSAAQLLTFALLARHLGVEQFALYASITAVTNLGVQICGIGSQESLIRRVAQDRGMFPVMLPQSDSNGLATVISSARRRVWS